MWKQLKLQCPVDDTCKYNRDDKSTQDFQSFVSLLTSSAEVFIQDHPLWTEIKVFQNVQAKYKRILHCDKCLQLLQSVGVNLRKMVILNLSKSYIDLAELFLKEIQSPSKTKHFPSRQQLEYLLIRTQSAAKLICEVLHYSTETFCYLIQRLKVGHMILNLMMATSVTAKLHVLLKGILIQIVDIYSKIYVWRFKLKAGKFEWPQSLDLPEDLDDWLKKETNLTQSKQLPTEQVSFLKDIFEKQKRNSEKADLVIDLESEDECIVVADSSSQQDESMDVGEVIPRDEENADVTSTTQEENFLLQKINETKSYRQLRLIWKSIQEWNLENALPKKLTHANIRKIIKMFEAFRQDLNKVKNKQLTVEERKKQNRQINKKYRLLFANFFVPKESAKSNISSGIVDNSSVKLEPVKTFPELKKLYKVLYTRLESANKMGKCKNLKKMFKSRKSDIELLVSNKEEKFARQMIRCTSKLLLTKYV